jgi:2-dehydropantoate 2-reductase
MIYQKNMSKKNIVVIGLGGVGGYFGFKYQENEATKEYNISFVAREATYEIVKRKDLHYFLRSMKTQLQDQMI